MGAADGGRILVGQGLPLQDGDEPLDGLDEQVAGPHQLERQPGVHHVGRRQAVMYPPRLRP